VEIEQPLVTSSKIFNKPARIFIICAVSIFIAEAVVMFVLAFLQPLQVVEEAFLDALLLTLILLPMIFLLIYKPLQLYITKLKKSEETLKISENRFRDIADNALEWIWEVDAEGKYTYASQAVEKILGHKPEEVLGNHFYDLFHPDDREELKTAAFDAMNAKQSFREFVNRNVHKEGHVVWLSTSGIPILDKDGKLLGYRGADADITERIKLEESLKTAATTDELTGLLNRRGFYTIADQHCKIAARNKLHMALIYADLDNMKKINDTLGHIQGDEALLETANMLKNTFRQSDIVARIGGDEFAVLLVGSSEPIVDSIVIAHIQDNLRIFNDQSDRSYELSLSMGVALYDPEHPLTINELLNQADKLMYEQKSIKKNS
jgi:diguanylate cyclase (GGDEF)-like protein/PAS domain S-box-containing protein